MRQKQVVVLIALALVVGCALKYKAVATKTVVAVEHGLNAIQDASFALCDPAVARPAVPTTCTAASAAAGQTTERYKTLHTLLEKAYGLQERNADALDKWRTGEPPPDSFLELSAVVKEIGTVASGLLRSDATQRIFDGLAQTLKSINDIAAIVGGRQLTMEEALAS